MPVHAPHSRYPQSVPMQSPMQTTVYLHLFNVNGFAFKPESGLLAKGRCCGKRPVSSGCAWRAGRLGQWQGSGRVLSKDASLPWGLWHLALATGSDGPQASGGTPDTKLPLQDPHAQGLPSWRAAPWAARQGQDDAVARGKGLPHRFSESEPSAWALPTHTVMATPLRCSRPGSLRGVLMVTAQSGARLLSAEPGEDVREDSGLCSQSASFSRSRHLRGCSGSGGG